jgi:hypothetical protein
MKKFFAFFVFFVALIFAVSCGGSSKSNDQTEARDGDSQPDDTDTDTASDDDSYAVPDDDADSGREPWPPDDCFYTRCANPPEPEPEPECVLDESIINSDAEKYFGFKGVGKINSADISDPDWANLVKKALEGVDGKDLDYANSYSFFFETSFNAYGGLYVPAVALEAIGDPNMSTGRFTTIAYAMIPVQFIDILKEHKEFGGIFPVAPVVQIFDLAYTSDDAYVKECLIAENRYAMNEVFGQETAVGKTQACFGKYNDKTFAAGEPFQLAMNAELVLVDTDEDVGSADLCTCYKTEDWSVVDCPEISWE